MLTIPDNTLESWLREDVPFFDLTTHALGLGKSPGRIVFSAREDVVVCGTEEAVAILRKLGATCAPGFLRTGAAAHAGDVLLSAHGTAESLHAAWKVCVNILEHASGIAGAARGMVETARKASPAGRRVTVAATRKGFPGTRELATKAVLAGGAVPHRLGLSETLLVFPQHRSFLKPAAFREKIDGLRNDACGKKLIVETSSAEDALGLAELGIDGLQLDKIPPDALAPLAAALRQARPGLLLFAAGGITRTNVAAYAATGVDVLVTSSLYCAAPADIGASLSPV